MKPLSFVYSGMIGQGGFAMETPRAEITMMASLSVASVDGRVMFQGVLSPGGKITFFTLPGPLLLMDRQYILFWWAVYALTLSAGLNNIPFWTF